MADKFLNLYPTTLLHRRLDGMEEVNRQLAIYIAEIEASEPNDDAGKATQGGFQTGEDLFQRDHPAMNVLKQHIIEALRDYANILIKQECTTLPKKIEFVLWGWAVSLKAGDSQGLHVHPNANISGVYYVTAPPETLEPGEGGKISFYDPRPRANMNQLSYQATRHRQSPTPGDMYIFPSWLEHSVSAFRGAGVRICVAFNARLVLS